MALETAREAGLVESFLPTNFKLPMVAPGDLGRSAAHFLSEPVEKTGLHFVEGPELYSPADVARAFADALGKPASVAEIPKAKWIEKYRSFGFSEAAAQSYARMTEKTISELEMAADPVRGKTALRQYVKALVERMPAPTKA
jgi:uncharacterized protein YbjT (DUF2867 family)